MSLSPKIANEIARLMRDPDALSTKREGMPRPGGHGGHDPNQPRVPAGDPRGGQFASQGYRGGVSGRDAGMRASLDGTQFTQLGSGNPASSNAQTVPFDGLFGDLAAGASLTSQSGFRQTERELRNPGTQAREFEAGRFKFLSTREIAVAGIEGGFKVVVSSMIYAYDPVTGAYATIRATPERPIEILEINGQVSIRPFR